MKLHKNPILLFVGVFLLYVLGNLIFRTKKSGESPKTEVVKTEKSGSLAKSDLGRLWETWDWNQTSPGKLLGTHVQADLVNWILWPIVAVLFYFLINLFINTVRGKSGGMSTRILVPVITIITLGVITVAIFGDNKGGPTGKEVEAPVIREEGRAVVMTVGIADTIKTFAPQYPRADGKTVYKVCAEVIGPKFILRDSQSQTYHFMPQSDQTRQHNLLKLDEGMKQALLESNHLKVEVEFTLRKALYGTNPCERTLWNGKLVLPAQLGQ